jgi:large subunit ribosomal protein L25
VADPVPERLVRALQAEPEHEPAPDAGVRADQVGVLHVRVTRRGRLALRPPGYNRAPMAGERIKLEVRDRESLGSRESRRLRRAGFVPGVLYGAKTKAHPFCVEERELRRVLTGGGGLHVILDVVLEGQKSTHPSVLKSYQQDPLKGRVLHIDLHEVRLDQPIQAVVTVQLIGESAGTKEGGVLSQVARELNVEALPLEVPEHIDADVSEMRIGDTLRLADLDAIEGVTFLDDPEETVIANVTLPTIVEEPEEELEEGEEGELEEGEIEGAAEGESPEAEAGTGEQGEPG